MGPLEGRARSNTWRWQFWLAGAVLHLAVFLTLRLHFGAGIALPERLGATSLVLLEPFPPPPTPPVKAVRKPAPRVPPTVAPVETPAASTDATPPPAEPTDTGTTEAAAPAMIHRDLGDARLWVRPLAPDQLAAIHRLTRTTAQLADSVSRAVIQAYLDSMAVEAEKAPRPPSWVGTIAGARFGLDSRYVYVAGLRIPTILLGLLPISGGANQSKAFDRSDEMFDDLRRAAARSATLDDFKAAVRELRAQSEEEHQLNQAGREGRPEEAPGIGTEP